MILSKYRILEKVIDGKACFYPQRRSMLFFWKTIKTEYNLVFDKDGRWQDLYSAKSCLDDYRRTISSVDVVHKVEEDEL